MCKMGRDGEHSSRKRKRDSDKDKKLLQKMLETKEEKRARRLKKKADKETRRQKKQEQMLGGYTNSSNPFGDSNLTERFVWKLKREKDMEKGINPDELDSRRERERLEELQRDLEKAKKRRQEREAERELWEAERLRMAREREGQNYEDWERQEHEFHREQAKRRSEIRIKEGRPKPIDILYKNLNMDNDYEIEMNEPYKLFSNLSIQDLEELKRDIQMYLELDTHTDFWEALAVVCDDEIEQIALRERQARKPG